MPGCKNEQNNKRLNLDGQDIQDDQDMIFSSTILSIQSILDILIQTFSSWPP